VDEGPVFIRRRFGRLSHPGVSSGVKQTSGNASVLKAAVAVEEPCSDATDVLIQGEGH
jgi:hypothetical protein